MLHETVHYSALPYIASYFHDFSVCIFTGMLSPLFPMAFFFSYGVNLYFTHASNFTIRIFQLSSFQRTPMMFWGIPSRHRYSLILSGITSFRSFTVPIL